MKDKLRELIREIRYIAILFLVSYTILQLTMAYQGIANYDGYDYSTDSYNHPFFTLTSGATSEILAGPDPKIFVQTDKQSYITGETAVVSGAVRQLIPGNSQVRLDIYDSDGNVVTTNLRAILEDKNFTTYLGTTSMEPAEYRIAVTYGMQTGQTILTVTTPQPLRDSFDKNAIHPIPDNVTTPVNDQNVTTVKSNLENNKFIKYENMDYLLSILYPSNWTKLEENLQPHQVVGFYALSVNGSAKGTFTPRLLISVESLQDPNTQVEDYTNQFIQRAFSNASEFRLINSTEGYLGDNKAQWMTMYDYSSQRTLKELRVFSVIGGNIYRIGYFSEPGMFSNYLKTITTMLESFNTTSVIPQIQNSSTKVAQETIVTVPKNIDANRSASSSANTTETSAFSDSRAPLKEGGLLVKFVKNWGSFGHQDGQFDHPTGIAIDPESRVVYVADINNNRIQKFSLDGKFISSWGPTGNKNAQLNHPADVSIDPKTKNIYVADILNNRVAIFTSEGKFLSSFGSKGTGDGQFDHPGNIAIDSEEKMLYVADVGNSRIQKFDSGGKFFSEWGSPGISPGQLNRPAGLDIDSKDKKIFVADTKNNRIQVFSNNGKFLSEWGSPGKGKGQFQRPTDINIDEINKLIYVTDNENSRIQVFNMDGSFVTAWGTKGTGTGQFTEPTGIAINSQEGMVYIVDKPGNRINIFDVSNGSLEIESNENFSQYSNSTIGVKLLYPGNWHLSQAKGVVEVVMKADNNLSGIGASLGIKPIAKLSEGNSLEYYLSLRSKSITEDPRTHDYNETRNHMISGHSAYRMVYTAERNGVDFFFVQFLTADNSRVYSITFASPTQGYTDYLKSAQEIIRSIEFLY